MAIMGLEATAGEALVRVNAAGINPGEASIRKGLMHDRFPAPFPSGEGSDLAGVVEEVGPGVDSVAVGDEVIGWTDKRASHAEFVVVPAEHLVPRQAGVSWEAAGALFVASNGDLTIPGRSGIAPGNGSLVQVIAAATGVRPLVAGKPEPPLHHESVLRTGARHPLVVGDRLDTDIEGAHRVGADSLRASQVVELARRPGRHRPALDPEAMTRMDASVALRDELIASRRPVYGVTTGFGDSNVAQISPEKAAALQRNLVAYHLLGSGPLAPPDVVRATLLLRANCLARGRSGVRREVVQLLLDCLSHDILPVIPERGSVGASGDLIPLCHLTSVLVG